METGSQPDFVQFFQNYAAAFNRSLGDAVDISTIRSFFASAFIGASPAGVACGANDESLVEAMTKGYAFYKEVGTNHLDILDVQPNTIYELHHVVRVGYRAHYLRKAGTTTTIDFAVSYLVQMITGEPKIFGFITGDEMAAFREHGLLED